MRKFLFWSIVFLFALGSCQDNEIEDLNYNKYILEKGVRKSSVRMRFSTSDELQSLLDQMKSGENSKIKTRTNNGFVSLNDYITQIALDSLTGEQLKEVEAEGLIFDPEDDLISDPDFCDLINANREIEVGGKVYKYVPEGVLRCDASEDTLLNNPDLIIPATRAIEHSGENFIVIKGSLEFLPIEYDTKIIEENAISQPQGNTGLGNLVLGNNVTITPDCIRDVRWGHKGDAGWLQHGVSLLLSKNTIAECKFDKRHRMKLRMYEQNYIVARTIGMTLRMQKRLFRIWWRKKADEFRYGWTGLELQYQFKGNPIPGVKTPNWPKDNLGIPKVPDFIAKRFPFYENDIVLFYVPFINYPVETNDINKVFWGAMGKVAANLRHELKNYNKQGVFTREPKPKDNFLRVVIPQIERYTRNDGREVYRFDTSWWSGSYTVGVQLYPNIAYASVSYSQPYRAHIERGCVYGAVKWNGKWRAARIYTGD